MIRRHYGTTHAPDTHQRNDWRERALCATHDDPDLWFPNGNNGPAVLQAKEAKAVCARCPVMSECGTWALDTGIDYGVLGGLTEDERRALRRRPAQPELAPCGTKAAYRRHYRRNEEPCAECRTAQALDVAEREAKRKAQIAAVEKQPPTITEQCGTTVGYRRHHRVGEEPCAECRAANTEANRRQRRRQLTGKAA